MNSHILTQSMNHQERKEILKSFLLIFMELLHWMPPKTFTECSSIIGNQGGGHYDSKLKKKSSASNESIHELTDNQKVGLQYVSGHVLQNQHKNIVKLTLLKAIKPWPSLRLENWTAWTWTHTNQNWFQAWVEGGCGQLHCQLSDLFEDWWVFQTINFKSWCTENWHCLNYQNSTSASGYYGNKTSSLNTVATVKRTFFLCELLELLVLAIIVSSLEIIVVQRPITSRQSCKSVFFVVVCFALLSIKLVFVKKQTFNCFKGCLK